MMSPISCHVMLKGPCVVYNDSLTCRQKDIVTDRRIVRGVYICMLVCECVHAYICVYALKNTFPCYYSFMITFSQFLLCYAVLVFDQSLIPLVLSNR